MSKKVVILGGHGDGIVVLQAVRDIYEYDKSISVLGFLNDVVDKDACIKDISVLGRLEAWKKLEEDILFYPALHKVKLMNERIKRIEQLGIPDHRWVTIVHPTSTVPQDVNIGCGSFVASHVTIQPDSEIGRFVSIRAGANIGHDVIIDDYAYVGPNATLCGRSRLQKAAHLGPNAAVSDGKIVGSYAVVGIGTAVIKDIEDNAVYMGNPARKVSSIRGNLDS